MFKYSVIGDNTPEMRKWLESIGYKYIRWDVAGVRPDTPYLTAISNGSYTEHTLDQLTNLKELMASNGDVLHDCSHNHKLFKAVTAIREDNDYMQWFMSQTSKITQAWYLCEEDSYVQWAKKQKPFLNSFVLAHKATIEELQEHFKK